MALSLSQSYLEGIHTRNTQNKNGAAQFGHVLVIPREAQLLHSIRANLLISKDCILSFLTQTANRMSLK